MMAQFIKRNLNDNIFVMEFYCNNPKVEFSQMISSRGEPLLAPIPENSSNLFNWIEKEDDSKSISIGKGSHISL